MKKDSGGVMRFIYPAILFAAGVLVWMHFQAPVRDYYRMSVDFDNRLVAMFNARGIDDRSIIVQTRQEHAKGKNRWIEYYREIAVADGDKRAAVGKDIRRLGEKEGYSVRVASAADAVDITVKKGKALFSQTVLSAPRAAEIKRPLISVSKRGSGRIALVIDDIGGSMNLDPYLDLNIPITFAIMPRERHSRDIAHLLETRKMPYILHLPLEPMAYPAVNPGKASLLVSMSPEAMRSKFLDDLNDVPGASGVSNHMGSRFTSDRKNMDFLMSLLKEKGLFFFDSYTSSSSVAGISAVSMKVPHATNSFFLDIKDEAAFMEHQWGVAKRHARKYGTCIVIGHIQKKNMIPVLQKTVPEAQAEGYTFVYLTDMVR